ncbi:DUF4251 domain-containing protein [Thermoflavifilum aggregans]|nr:DUF4251 domain-containing protein [Thermoflavifilum aggregans]
MKTAMMLALLCGSLYIAQAQHRLQGQALEKAVQERAFTFYANQALPLKGRVINLTDLSYTLKVMPDSLYAHLPYFGVAYVAPMNPNEGGIHIKSGAYRYELTRKKSGWHLTLFPTGSGDVYRMDLDMSTDGYASLYLIPNQREAISYAGIISQSDNHKR